MEVCMKAMMVLSVAIALSVSSTPRAIAGDPPGLKQYSAHFGCYDPGGKTTRTTAKIKGTKIYADHEEQEIYQDVRLDTDGYTLKVPNGSYHVLLKFCEIQKNAIGQRIFGVKVQGQQVADRLDIFAKVGKNMAYELRSPDVKVTNGLLKIEFVRIVGSPCIAAIMVGGDIDGAQNAVQRSFGQQINCGGGGFRGYEPDFGF
jgi:hypothetical protein